MNPNIFRAYDIRGVYGKDFDFISMAKIGFAIGKIYEGKNFVVGNDIRKSSEVLATSLISGLLAAGASVTYVGVTNIGATFFAGLKMRKDISLYITASHLPPKWNGLKLYYGNGLPFSTREIKKIKEFVFRKNFKVPSLASLKSLEITDLKNEYIKYLLSKFKLENKLKIVIDCGNGSMSLVAPEIFKRLGARVIEVFCGIDPFFKKRESDPAPENIKTLIRTVKKEKADMGVAFDGDGDRVTLVDEEGRVLTGNEIGIILGKELLKKKKGKVITTVACSMAIKEVLENLGGKVMATPVGHAFVGRYCIKQKAVLGIEESGHMYIPSYFPFNDGILPSLVIAQIISKTGRRLSELEKDIPRYPFEEIVFDCPDERKFKIIEKIKKRIIREKKYKKLQTIDGVKVIFDNGWALIRASNTSPVIRLYVEAKTENEFKKLKQKYTRILKEEISK